VFGGLQLSDGAQTMTWLTVQHSVCKVVTCRVW
jgi:hypothetical protein